MEGKYGNLYPGRAVAPLRILAERLRREAADSDLYVARVSHHSIDMALRDLDALGFPPDEPLFLLRGQDELAPETVMHYAYDWSHRLDRKDAQEVANRIAEWSERMAAWQPRKMPD